MTKANEAARTEKCNDQTSQNKKNQIQNVFKIEANLQLKAFTRQQPTHLRTEKCNLITKRLNKTETKTQTHFMIYKINNENCN